MNIKRQLKKESKIIIPNVKNRVLSKLGIEEKVEKRRFNFYYAYGLIALVLVVGLLFILQPTTVKSNSIITVDINPSIELEVNKKNTVIGVRPLNLDGAYLLEQGLSLENKHIEEAIEELIEYACALNYLDGEGTVIIETINDNEKQENTLKRLLQDRFKNNPNILVSLDDEEVQRLAKEYKVTVGKMKVIKKICERTSCNIKELSKRSIKELNLMAREIDEVKLNEFRNEYKYKIDQLRNKREEALKEYQKRYNDILKEINKLDKALDRNNTDETELRSRLINLIDTYFPDYEGNIGFTRQALRIILNNLKVRLAEEKALIEEIINEKYNIQFKYFDLFIKEQIKANNRVDFNIHFDISFSFEKVKGKRFRNLVERNVLKRIEEVELLLQLAENNEEYQDMITKELEAKMNDLEDLLNSQDISSSYRNSQIVKQIRERVKEHRNKKEK